METMHSPGPKVVVSKIRGKNVVHLEWSGGERSWMPDVDTANTLADSLNLLNELGTAVVVLDGIGDVFAHLKMDGRAKDVRAHADRMRAVIARATGQ